MTKALRSLLLLPLILSSCLQPLSTSAQNLFNKAFWYEGYMGNLEPVSDPQGFLICATVRFGPSDNIGGFQFTRFDSTGSVISTKSFSTGPIYEVMQGVALASYRSNGTFSLLFGSHPYNGPYRTSLRLFNVTSLGGMNWNRKIEYINSDYSVHYSGAMEPAFEESPDGGYLITALRRYPSGSDTDTLAPMTIKLDSVGNVQWNKTYNLGETYGWHITSHVDDIGTILLGFHADTPNAIVSDNNILTKIAPNGSTIWSKRLDGFNGRLTGSTMVNGNYAVSAMDSASIYILELDTSGIPLWGKRYALTFPLWTWGASIVPTRDHGFVLTALMPDSTGSADVFFFKVDSLGTAQWQRAYGNSHSESLVDLVQNWDSTFTMLSRTQLTNSSVHNYMSQLDSEGMNDCMTSVNCLLTEEPITFSLVDVVLDEFESPMISQPLYVNDSTSTNPTLIDTCLFSDVVGLVDLLRTQDPLVYPNPTSGTVSVRTNNHWDGTVLNIIDMMGRQVNRTELSSWETIIDLEALPVGVYLYHVVAPDGRTVAGKLIKE
jgi:hypothetical protein